MSVIQNKDESEENITAILSELKIIDEQHKQRDRIYRECLSKFLNHLNTEAEQLTSTVNGVENRNNNIRQSFQAAYDTIYDGADRALRSIRRTYEVKYQFWEQTIQDFATSDSLQFKKDLYALKNDTEEKLFDAIDVRKSLKKVPFKRVFTKKQADKSLANFQDSNNEFEERVYMGTNTTNRFRPLQNTYFNNENKQNQANGKNTNRSNSKNGQTESILNQFVKK